MDKSCSELRVSDFSSSSMTWMLGMPKTNGAFLLDCAGGESLCFFWSSFIRWLGSGLESVSGTRSKLGMKGV